MDIEHWIFVLQLQRVLANLAIDEEVGHQAASNTECMELLTKVVGELCMYVQTYVSYKCVYVYYVHTYVCMYVRTYVQYVCMYVRMCTYVCMYVCVHIIRT